MTHLHDQLGRLKGRRILVVGDALLDRYIWGEVERVSPEAPVPVVLESRVSEVLGGALNVARNIVAAGGRAAMVGITGSDAEAKRIAALMADIGIAPGRLIVDPARPTVVKTRIMSGGQQLLRLDRESSVGCSAEIERCLIESARKAIRGCQGVILSDYRKGVVTRGVVEAVVSLAKAAGIPVVADPKLADFRHYAGADYLTPNLKEAAAAAGRDLSTREAIEREGRRLARQYKGKGIVITRGHDGVSVLGPREAVHIPAQAREVFDVTGAGDTLIAHFTLALAAGFDAADAARIGNAAAGVAVSKIGAVTVSPEELAAALGAVPGTAATLSKVRSAEDLRLTIDQLRSSRRKIVFTNGCFDLFHAGHVRLLQEARALGDVLIVALNSDASVRRIKGDPRPILPARERAAVLSALGAVDYIVFFEEDTPERLLAALHPDILVKGHQKTGEPVVGTAIVESAGGQVVELPLFEATSTGELVEKLRGKPKSISRNQIR